MSCYRGDTAAFHISLRGLGISVKNIYRRRVHSFFIEFVINNNIQFCLLSDKQIFIPVNHQAHALV